MSHADASVPEVRIDVLLCEGFILTEVAAIIDPMRIAARLGAEAAFRVTLRSAAGGPVVSAGGLVAQTERIPARPDADTLIVPGNADPSMPGLNDRRIRTHYLGRAIPVVLLAEAATRHIGDGAPTPLTTHWEHRSLLAERDGLLLDPPPLASEAKNLTTAAGMETTSDLVLRLMARHISPQSVARIAEVLLHGRIREAASTQLPGAAGGTGDSAVDAAVNLMRENMENPLSASDVAARMGLSTRTLERRFQAALGANPATHYRRLRLHQARFLLLHTAMPLTEVAIACGFPGGMSQRYREHFGVTPRETRAQAQSRPVANADIDDGFADVETRIQRQDQAILSRNS